MSLSPRLLSDILKLPNITTRRLSFSEGSSSCDNQRINRSTSLSDSLDRISNTVQIYSTLAKPEIGQFLPILTNNENFESTKSLTPELHLDVPTFEIPKFDLSQFFGTSPPSYFLTNSIEFLNHTTTDSKSSSIFGDNLPLKDFIEQELEEFPESLLITETAEATEQTDSDTNTLPPPEDNDLYIEDDLPGIEPEPEQE